MSKFIVVIPAFNRAAFLPRALDSLLEQTFQDWRAIVLDDGSSDSTAEVVGKWVRDDLRISYKRFEENRGGVAINEVGMQYACDSSSEYWTRLGSDDWFGPRKLELDAWALERHEACWGCYHVEGGPYGGQVWGPSMSPAKVRASLHRGHFVASWANIAMHVEVLRQVKSWHGNFVDPRLRNMEDFVFNARAAALVALRWRGIVNGAFCDADTDGLLTEQVEGVWCDRPGGATAAQETNTNDNVLSRKIIHEEFGQ